MRHFTLRRHVWLLTGLLCVLLSACQNPLSRSPVDGPAAGLLKQAAHATSPQRDGLLLQAALLLQPTPPTPLSPALGKILRDIHPDQLNGRALADYSVLRSRLAVQEHHLFEAESILFNDSITQLLSSDTPPDSAIALRLQRGSVARQLENPETAVQEYVAIYPLLAQTNNDANKLTTVNEALWRTLGSFADESLMTLAASNDTLTAGWAQLALINRSNQDSADAQIEQLNGWLTRFPEHPARRSPPLEIASMKEAISARPARITLLLPLTGKLAAAGQSIRDGLMAAYFESTNHSSYRPQIDIVDSNTDEANFLALYLRVAQNSDLVIGPLKKDHVAILQQQAQLTTPTLALNHDEKTAQHPDNLYYFGLNPDDDAAQAARQAWQLNYRRAMLVYANTDWGQRMATAFESEWSGLSSDTSIAAKVPFTATPPNYQAQLAAALETNTSHQRQQDIQRITGLNLEFTPRRRHDIDVIFLVARPEEGRQIRPALAFQYAGDIPVFATSMLYGGRDEPEKNQDLDGIQLPVMPWLLENSAVKRSITARTTLDPNTARLYTLGIDAWRLSSRLLLMSQNQGYRLQGSSGILAMDTKHQVVREQLWMTLQQGMLSPLTAINASALPQQP